MWPFRIARWRGTHALAKLISIKIRERIGGRGYFGSLAPVKYCSFCELTPNWRGSPFARGRGYIFNYPELVQCLSIFIHHACGELGILHVDFTIRALQLCTAPTLIANFFHKKNACTKTLFLADWLIAWMRCIINFNVLNVATAAE